MTGFLHGTCDCCLSGNCGLDDGSPTTFYDSGFGTGTECAATLSATISIPEITCVTDCTPCQTVLIIPAYSGSITVTQDGKIKCKYTSSVTSVSGSMDTVPCSASPVTYNNRRIEVYAQSDRVGLLSPIFNDICGSDAYCCGIMIYVWDYWEHSGGGTDLAFGYAIGYKYSAISNLSDPCPCYNGYANGTASTISNPSVWQASSYTCCDNTWAYNGSVTLRTCSDPWLEVTATLT